MSSSFDKSREDYGDLIDPFIVVERYDICPHCKAQRLELFSFNGYPQDYKGAVDAYLQGFSVVYDRYEIRNLRCRSCNKEFVIDWTTGFPIPLKSTYRTNRFFAEYAEGY